MGSMPSPCPPWVAVQKHIYTSLHMARLVTFWLSSQANVLQQRL